MSARSPFRSHLLQQWTNSRRSPIVVQQWLHQETIREEEEEGISPSRSSPHRTQQSRRSFHSSPSREQDSFDLSSVDTTPTIALVATQNSWAASLKSETKQNRIQKELYSRGRSTTADYNNKQTIENSLFDVGIFANTSVNEDRRTKSPHSRNDSIVDIVGESTNSSLQVTNSKRVQQKDPREVQLAVAIDRAVKLSKITHKHRLCANSEGQLLTFRRLFSWSRSGQKLMDICFEATLRSTGNDSTARKEKERWSQIPAFLVAIIHENQAETVTDASSDDDLYAALGYSPPTTEGQLQDYASACAAAQTAIHSLQADGYSTEWVTSSVTKTPAFRSLVKAKPTDRIAALIKVDDRPRGEHISARQL